MVETTFIIVKPDAMKRGLTWKIMQRFEDKGLKFVGGKLVKVSKEQAELHYEEHKGKPFFNDLVNFITECPVFAAILQGDSAVSVVRHMVGKTNHKEAEMGTIRGDFAIGDIITFNVIHASDSVESAEREMKIYFNDNEIYKI